MFLRDSRQHFERKPSADIQAKDHSQEEQDRFEDSGKKVGIAKKEEDRLTERRIFRLAPRSFDIRSRATALEFDAIKGMTLTSFNAQPRPKPPVDPRVRAVDVLDTGMQIALERGDVPMEIAYNSTIKLLRGT